MSPIDNSKKKGENDMNNFLQKDTEIIKALLEKQFSENNIQSIERLGGLTNRSYHVVLSDREIVFRIREKVQRNSSTGMMSGRAMYWPVKLTLIQSCSILMQKVG